MSNTEHCPECGRFVKGSYPVWECSRHGTFHAMMVPLQPKTPAPDIMPGQSALDLGGEV